jgi:large subunit ribosomal protein L13
MKTFSQKPADVTRTWHVVDASSATLGRVAATIASLLIGKHKPTVTAHVDGGDYVVVINTDKLQVTGDKMDDKKYYRHSQYPGSLKTTTLAEQMGKDSTKVIYEAVRGMLPKNKLSPARLERLKLYKGAEHAHAAQAPVVYEMKEGK